MPELRQGRGRGGGRLPETIPLFSYFLLCRRAGVGRGEWRSDELEQEVLEGVQAPAGVPQGPIRAQLGSQEEQLPVFGHGAQRQGFMQLRHAHGVRLIL